MNPSLKISNWDKAMDLLRNTEDPITAMMLNSIVFFMLEELKNPGADPPAEVDFLFFLTVMRKWCSRHDSMQRMLDEDIKLSDWD